MNEIIPQQFQNTVMFLQDIIATHSNSFNEKEVIHDLISNLKSDGFEIFNLNQQYHLRRNLGELSGSSFYIDISCVFICVLCAGLASGLTQGLLSLDFMEMKIKSTSGTPKDKKNALKVLPIIKHHHFLLVTLMLWNACAAEALPIFLNSLVNEYMAIIISVTLVLMFGEIIPASILTGPKQLQIAATLTPLVWMAYFVFFPIAYPISKLLDCIVGHESGLTLYNKREIVTMMKIQHEEAQRRSASGAGLRDSVHHDEMTIIGGALKFRDMKVSEVMTTIENVFMISAKESLSYKTLYEIFKAGYSRIPVYGTDKNDIIGLLLAKDLIFVDPEDETPIENFVEFFGRRPMTVWHDQLLGETLSSFRRERAHLAIVRDVVFEGEGDPYYKVVGIITLEDIIEEILGAEIEDEFDVDETNEENSPLFHLRDMDLARLKSLRSKITDDHLSEDEINAIVNFLPKNVQQINDYTLKYKLSLYDVIKKSDVFLLKKQTPEGAMKPHPNDIIVRKGKFTNTCILILQGRVKVVPDMDAVNLKEKDKEKDIKVMKMKGNYSGFEQEQIIGPWSTLCADALLTPDGTFAPNFTAFIHSTDLRFVRISTVANKSLAFQAQVQRRKSHHVHAVEKVPHRNLSTDSGHRLRTSMTVDPRTFGRPSNVRHSDGQTGDDESMMLRRSVTHDPKLQRANRLSGEGEISTGSNTYDRKSLLLAHLNRDMDTTTGSISVPIYGSSANSDRSSFVGSYRPGRSVSEFHEPIESNRISNSLTRDSFLARDSLRIPKLDNKVSAPIIVAPSSVVSSAAPSNRELSVSHNSEKSVESVESPRNLSTPLIDHDTFMAGELEMNDSNDATINKLHARK